MCEPFLCICSESKKVDLISKRCDECGGYLAAPKGCICYRVRDPKTSVKLALLKEANPACAVCMMN